MAKGKEPTKEVVKDRIDMRLFNTIVIFDMYTVARSPEEAREALLAAIREGSATPTENTAKEVTMHNSIRQSWIGQKPWFATDITDEEFEQLKPLTVGEVWERFYKKAKQ